MTSQSLLGIHATTTGHTGWSGYGIINGYVTMYNDDWCTKTSIQMHEIGHNLGLRHSRENGSEYADTTGMMGHSYNDDDGPIMCFNTAKNWELGWYETKHLTINPLVQKFWEGKLIGYPNYKDPNAPVDSSVIVKIEGHNKNYFVGFNLRAGINRQNQEADAWNKVIVHSVGTSVRDSELEAKLGVGETFEIPDFGGGTHSVLIQVIHIDMGANPPIAKIDVSLMKCTSDADCEDGSSLGCTTNTCNLSTGTCHHEPNNLCTGFMKMVLLTDRYPSETFWKIIDNCNGNAIVMSGGNYKTPFETYEDSANLPPSQYTIQIDDSYGDGICCAEGNGSFRVTFNDEAVAGGGQFGKSESQTWGSCNVVRTSEPTASPTKVPTESPTNAPTTCELSYTLTLDAGPSLLNGPFWEIVFDENRLKIAANSGGISYTSGSTYMETGCIVSDCYRFHINGGIDSYSLLINGREVAGSDEYFSDTEVSLFGTCNL